MSSRPDPRRLAGAPRDVQDSFLLEAVRADPRAAFVLDKARDLALPDAWLFSGAIYQNAWNALCGLPPGHGVNDYDLGYFDPDLSWQAEDAVIRRCAPHFQNLGAEVEVRNQARVPLWFSKKYGVDRRPLVSTPDAISQFAAHAHAVGVRAGPEGDEICAPYGLDDIFNLTITVRQPLAAREAFEAKVKRQGETWPVRAVGL